VLGRWAHSHRVLGKTRPQACRSCQSRLRPALAPRGARRHLPGLTTPIHIRRLQPDSPLTADPDMSEAPATLAATLADRYRLERELGRGGMAVVYLARDLKHEQRVALKVIRPELAGGLDRPGPQASLDTDGPVTGAGAVRDRWSHREPPLNLRDIYGGRRTAA
jgi:hypothetical protein